MSISPISSLLSVPVTAASAVGAQRTVLSTAIGIDTLKDRIELSKEVIALLAAGAPPAK